MGAAMIRAWTHASWKTRKYAEGDIERPTS